MEEKKPAADKKAAPLKAAVKAKKETPKKLESLKVKGKGYRGKKLNLKFVIDCTHPVEDGIMNAADFVSILKMARHS